VEADGASWSSDVESLFDMFRSAIDDARSIRDVEARLLGRPYITSVHVGEYLLKSEPPQRHVTVTVRDKNLGTTVKVINVVEQSDGRLRMAGMSDT
jgi:hypothetical protein